MLGAGSQEERWGERSLAGRQAGRAVSLTEEAERHDRQWLHGLKPSRKAFA